MQSFHSDILFSINRFLNPIDRSLLKCTCKRFFDYWKNTPKIKISMIYLFIQVYNGFNENRSNPIEIKLICWHIMDIWKF
jgi:hypothetical protein